MSCFLFCTECHYAECCYAEWHYDAYPYGECHYAECRYDECHNAESHKAERRDALFLSITVQCLSKSGVNLKKGFFHVNLLTLIESYIF